MTRKEHLLVIMMEECAEIAQQCSKALRFGLEEIRPQDSDETNAESINREISDLVGVLEMLQDDNHLQLVDYDRVAKKKEKVEHFLKYSKEVGTLQE